MIGLGPRLVVSGTSSGVGKTTVATGVMAALARRGLRVAAAKVGPDFIDPGYHRLATGRPSSTLDVHLQGPHLVPSLAAAASQSCDLLVVEGVMGMFDGSAVPGEDGSTAHVAELLEAPVVLVVDASAMSGSVAALMHGFTTFRPGTTVAGVVVNRVGGEGHAVLLREALEPLGIPVLGVVPMDDDLVWRERHLGLVPVAERPEQAKASLARLAAVIERCVDLGAVLDLAAAAPARTVARPPEAHLVARARVAVCAGPAFSFTYPENLALLEGAGAELSVFDPLSESKLPEGASALYAGGGFPEIFGERLSANQPLLAEIRDRVAGGMTTWAECGGLLLLSESLDGLPMAGALPGVHARMTERLSIGYREATTRMACFFGPEGTVLRGHEYHCSATSPDGRGLALAGRFGSGEAGFLGGDLFASYLHQHLGAAPELAEAFVRRAGRPAGQAHHLAHGPG